MSAPTQKPALSEAPNIHPDARVLNCDLGIWTEVGARTEMRESNMGDYSYIVQEGDVVWSTIGKFCSIARRVRINPGNHATWRASQHHFTYRAAAYDLGDDDTDFFQWRKDDWVTIGHDVWIGHNATVLAGVSIGTGAIVAAGAVVSKDVAPYTVVGGVAAKEIKRRFTKQQEQALIDISWWDWNHDELKQRLPDFRKLSIDEFIEKYR
ncbi:putative acetyltransferase (virginiamycin, streptogramin A, chloramphenicol) [Stappia aggregata IAM 12614]|uniref:Putative acetyltransferase (Virginiamycin, streptogramin A, chloramphenicol) n=1 Tax=Roseibium aggregatum (strain ATCC 25650 / DSM 13394 / JCM 20685 / NBRC 16684 / NCIMB 2208 / IAM 12614 / B1) TaxID=384765 RepID=A0NM92_ROSAI|nr:DapH/DapD/GlmU-related protein [Roseibium aggregatum]EAV46187.1 putative acetyltransferase (virginiamycin, streptogramin A, chloramphenicol) [Stappia aggregata IAM 12614] [Roseibium aggregatum IAM 12614]